MRRFALAMALACVLSGVIRAGEIHSTRAVGEIPTSDVAGEIPTSGAIGEIHTTGQSAPEESTTALTIILTLISIVP